MSQGIDPKLDQKLYEILVSIHDPDEMILFVDDLLTPRDRYDAVMRIKIASRLKSGMGVRVTADRLQVSTKTVTRVHKILRTGRGYKLAFKRWEEWLLDPSRKR